MAKLLKLRRGTTTQHGSFTGAEGEVTVDTDKESLVVHDGSTAGGFPIARENLSNVSSATITGRLGTGSIVKAKLEADIIDNTKVADNAVAEENIHISNAGTNGQYLQKQSGNAGGLTWATVDLTSIAGTTFTDDVLFDGATAGRDVTWDKSDNSLRFADNAKAKFGTSDDLEIFHGSDQSWIKDVGTNNLVIDTNGDQVSITSGGGAKTAARFIKDGAVKLSHNDSIKLETTASGIGITGGWTATNDCSLSDGSSLILGAGSDGILWSDGSNGFYRTGGAAGTFTIQSGAGTPETIAKFIGDGAVELYHNNSKKLETKSWGAYIDGGLKLNTDSEKLYIGTGDDLQIYHDGSHSIIKDAGTGSIEMQSNGTGIYLQKDSSEYMAKFITDGACEFYHDNAKKAETVSGGFTITGTCTATAYAGDGSALTGVQPFPTGTKMLFQQTAAPTGWTKVTSSVDNKALRLVSGTVGSGGNATFTAAFASYTPAGSVAATGNSTASFSANATTGNSGANTSSVSTGGTVNNHTLSNNQVPSHNHSFNVVNASGYGNTNGTWAPGRQGYNAGGVSTNNSGGGGSHSHGFSGSSHSHSVNNHTHSVSVSGNTGNHTHNAGAFSGTARDFAVQYLDVIIASKD